MNEGKGGILNSTELLETKIQLGCIAAICVKDTRCCPPLSNLARTVSGLSLWWMDQRVMAIAVQSRLVFLTSLGKVKSHHFVYRKYS